MTPAMTHNVLYSSCQHSFFPLFKQQISLSDNDALKFSNGWCVNFLSIVQTKLELHEDVVGDHTGPGKPLNRYPGT